MMHNGSNQAMSSDFLGFCFRIYYFQEYRSWGSFWEYSITWGEKVKRFISTIIQFISVNSYWFLLYIHIHLWTDPQCLSDWFWKVISHRYFDKENKWSYPMWSRQSDFHHKQRLTTSHCNTTKNTFKKSNRWTTAPPPQLKKKKRKILLSRGIVVSVA